MELSNAAKRCSMRKQSVIVAYLDFRPCYRRFHALGDRQASDGWVDCTARSGGGLLRSGGLGLWCRHFEISSDRRFRLLFLFVMISSFSSRHRLQFPLFRLYVLDCLMISHLISWSIFFFFEIPYVLWKFCFIFVFLMLEWFGMVSITCSWRFHQCCRYMISFGCRMLL